MNKDEIISITPIIDDYVGGYIESKPQNIEKWLQDKIQNSDPQRDSEDVRQMCSGIVRTATINTEMRESLNDALANGKSINSWFAENIMKSCEGMSSGQIAEHITACKNATLSALNQNISLETGQSDIEIPSENEKFNDDEWNTYRIKDLAYETADQIHTLGVSALGNDSGYEIAETVQPIIQTAFDGEVIATPDIKAVVAAALNDAVRKGLITGLPAETPIEAINNIAYTAINNLDSYRQIANGTLSDVEGIYQMAASSVATVAGMAVVTKGAALGAAVGLVFGPIGSAVGGAIGGLVGRFLGSKVMTTITSAARKIGSMAKTAVKKIGSKIKEFGSKLKNFLFG